MDTPADVYDRIQETIPSDLPDRVLTVIQQHRGKANAITRRNLVFAVFGHYPPANLANSSEDRQIREVIERLQDKHPILSSSGKGGYFYAESVAEIESYAAELNSRATKLLKKSKALVKQAGRFKKELQMRLPLSQ